MKTDLSGNIYKLYLIKVAKWFMLTMPILMLFYKDAGLSTEESFRLKAIYSITIFVLEIPSGYVADVWGRKRSLIMGTCLGTLGFLSYSFSYNFWNFLVAEIILGIGQSLISGADSALLYDSLKALQKEKDYAKYEGRVTAVGNFAEAGSAILGGLIAEISLRLPFYFQTGIAFIGVPAALFLCEPGIDRKLIKIQFRDILKIVRYALVEYQPLRWNLIFSSFIGTCTLTMAWIYQLYLRDVGFSFSQIGIVAALLNLTVGITTTRAYKFEKRLGLQKTIIGITVILITCYLLAGWFFSLTGLVFIFIFYIARGVATPVLKDYVNRLTDGSIRATVLSVRNFLIRINFALIGPMIGWMSDKTDLGKSMTLTGLIFLILCSYPLLQVLKHGKVTQSFNGE